MTTSNQSKSPSKRSRGENGVTDKVARAKTVVRLSDVRYHVLGNKVKNILMGINAMLPRNKWQSYQTSDYDNRPPNNLFAQFPMHEEREIRDLDEPPSSLEKIPLLVEKLQNPEWPYEHHHITSDALKQSIVFPLGCHHGYSFRLLLNEGYSPNEVADMSTVLYHDCHIILEMTVGSTCKVRFCIHMEEDEFPDKFILSIHFDFVRKMNYKDRCKSEEALWEENGLTIQEVLLSLLAQQQKGYVDDGPFLQLFYQPNNHTKPALLDQFAEVGLQM